MTRSRSRSPGHRPSKTSRHGNKGFKWKDKSDGVPSPRAKKRTEHRTTKADERGVKRAHDKAENTEEKLETASTEAAQTAQPSQKSEIAKQSVTTSAEPWIIVHVNDRLGTKAAIPCLLSDPIKLFKAQVAQRIGREPHEIMLRRQGERPFKDILTLADYGVSNGVQLDLELDTGD